MTAKAQRARGFTLLEVMVALAILGLGLTAILSAQAGAFKSASHARNISLATGLLRCKMSEVEEHLAREGFQELDESDTGPCCDDDASSAMRCAWKVEKPQLPEAKFGELNLDGLDLSTPGGAVGLFQPSADGVVTPPVPADSKPGDLAKTLAGANAGAPPDDMAAAAAGGMSAIAQLVMSMVYPSLKLVFEASTRRVVVTLTWREGGKDYAMELSQWLASPQKAGVTAEDPNEISPLSGTPPPTVPPPKGRP